MKTEDREKIYDSVDVNIQELIDGFNPELKDKANKITCFLSDCVEHPGLWGIYTHWRTCDGSIVIYVDNIWNHCEKIGADFMQFIKSVYLHELGHCLNLNERELKERGL